MRTFDRTEVERLAGEWRGIPEGSYPSPWFVIKMSPEAMLGMMARENMPAVSADLVYPDTTEEGADGDGR